MVIRKATCLDLRGITQVHVDSWITKYRNIIPDEYLNQLTYAARGELWKKNLENTNVFVAEDFFVNRSLPVSKIVDTILANV